MGSEEPRAINVERWVVVLDDATIANRASSHK